MGTQQGRKWDLTDCGHLSSEGSSYNLSSWPQGDHTNANDYSESGECTESPSTCLAEMLACAADNGYGTYSFYWYDPYGRNIFNYSDVGDWACSWVGRFGELNMMLEIYKPGLYYCYMTYPGGNTTKYFDIYEQMTEKYLHKQGNNIGSGNSWGAAKSTWSAAQSALSAGNNLNVIAGDYSTESGFSFSKSQNIIAHSVTGGYPNTTDSCIMGGGGPYTAVHAANPIEADGYINRWAIYGISSTQAKLKIYRGGNLGTLNHSTSTLIYNGSLQSLSSGWNTFSISPVSVQRGDIVGVYVDTADRTPLYYGRQSTLVESGDVGNCDFSGTHYPGWELAVRAWYEGYKEIILPRY